MVIRDSRFAFEKFAAICVTKNAMLILSLVSASLSSLPFISGRLWISAWIGFIPLFILLKDKNPRQAFFAAFLTGVFFWSFTIFWLIHVTLFGLILLILYLALYFGVFGWAVSFYRLDERGNFRFLCIPCLWVVLEYIRAHLFSGFGWASLGYSQYLNLPVIQISDIAGVYGVSFLIVLANLAIKEILYFRRLGSNDKRQIKLAFVYCLLLLGSVVVYGYYRINQSMHIIYGKAPSLKISLIQGNIPQEMKWDVFSRELILNKYIELTESAARDAPDLIIWPESASPGFLGEDDWIFDEVYGLSRRVKTPILLGSVVIEGNKYFNSALLLDSQGKIIGRYDKLHLVPFGEYVPFKKILRFLETIVPIGSFTPGKDYEVLGVKNKSGSMRADFSVLICFEDTIPEISRNFIKKGADFLINITNDGWYKDTPACYQHLSASVFRAAENRVSLVRSANTGISCFITSIGQIILRVSENNKDSFVQGYRTHTVYPSWQRSAYTYIGDTFVLLCFIFLAFCGIINRKTAIRKSQ